MQESTRPATPAPAPADRSGARPAARPRRAARARCGWTKAPARRGTPQPGANSFTEGQARSRIEAAGFSNVTELQKDDQGIWRGRGMRDGQQVSVALDFTGGVSSR